MKIAIVGAGSIGLALAAHVAQRATNLGIEAEARQATPAEEKHCYFAVPLAVEQGIIVEPMPPLYQASGFRHIPKEEVERNRRKAYNYIL